MNSSRFVSQARRARIAGLLLLLIFAALYLFTLDDGLRPGELQGGDLITHHYAQVQGRFSNAPGYPLYTMGGWLWFHTGRLLFGSSLNPIRLLSSYSTLWALVSLSLLYALCLRVIGDNVRPGGQRHPGQASASLARETGPKDVFGPQPGTRPTGNWPLALIVTTFYGLTYFFWYYAVTSEQYTSSVAWTLAVVYLAFRWEEARRDAFLLGLAFLMGVGLAHQVTVLAILPPLLWFVLSAEPRLLRRGRLALGAMLLALLPLLSYIFVYVRGAQHPEWRGAGEWATTWQWFLSFISTGQGRGELTWSWRPFFTAEFPSLTWREMTWPGLLAGLAGLAALGRRRAALLYATIVVYLVFCWIDRFGNWYQVIMPVYALLALGIAAGAGWLVRRASRRWVSAGVLALLVALAAYRGIASYPEANQGGRAGDLALAPGWAILADNPPQGALILATQEEAVSLNYVTEIWGRRPDLKAIDSRTARNLLSHGRVVATRSAFPIVITEVDPSVHFDGIGPTLAWIGLQPSTEIPADLLPLAHDFSDQLRLAGARVGRNALGEYVVTLVWQALRRPDYDWSVSVRLGNGDELIGQQDGAAPVGGAYPTTRWAPGEVVTDVYAFRLPASVAPDQLTVILYRKNESGGFDNLDVARFPLPTG